MKPHFFILGNPRSGTTLFRLMMNSHPSIVVPPECGFAEWHYDQFKTWSSESSKDQKQVCGFLDALAKSKKIETWELDFDVLKKNIEKNEPADYSELCELIYLAYAREDVDSIKIWGDKNNYFLHKTAKIHEIFPRAKYVRIIRDGRDVACSYIEMKHVKTESSYKPVLTDDVIEIAREWVSNNIVIDIFFSSLPDHSHITIKYEDLVASPEKTLKTVTGFLQIDFNSSMLSYYKIPSGKEPKDLLDWKSKTLEAPDASNVGRYKKVMPQNEIIKFNSIAQNYLTTYGYEL